MIKPKLGFLLFFILCNIIFVWSNLNIYYQWVRSPQDTFYPFIHGGHQDYYLYLSAIRESLNGAWTTPALFTSETTLPSIWYVYYILLGKMAAILHISPILAYHLARFISIEYMIIAMYLVSRVIIGRSLAFWAATVGFLSTVPPLMFISRLVQGGMIPSYWASLDPSGRMDYLPHHAFGIANLFATIFFLFSFYKKRKSIYFYLSLTGAFLQGLFFPPAALAIALGMPLSLGIYFIQKIIINKEKFDWKPVLPISLAVILAFITITFMKHESDKGFPWSQWQAWDMGLWNDLPHVNEYLIVGAFIALLASFPAILAIFTKLNVEFKYVFVAVWAILPYLLLPFTDIVGISRIRMAYMGNFVPLGILSVLSATMIGKKIRKSINRKIFNAAALITFLALSLPVTIYYLHAKTANIPIGFVNIHIPSGIIKSMDYLGKNAKPYSVILSEDYAGNIFPAFIKMKAYYGHVTQTKDFAEKGLSVDKFYSGRMTGEEALSFIKNGRIEYIFVGPIEMSLGADIAKYQLPISKVYDSSAVAIYKVKI